ncbi:hypothetical protein MY3296_007847 [Beauveria thailandica]
MEVIQIHTTDLEPIFKDKYKPQKSELRWTDWAGLYHSRAMNEKLWLDILCHMLANELGIRTGLPGTAAQLRFLAYTPEDLAKAKVNSQSTFGGPAPYKMALKLPMHRTSVFSINDDANWYKPPNNPITDYRLPEFAFTYPNRVEDMLKSNYIEQGISEFSLVLRKRRGPDDLKSGRGTLKSRRSRETTPIVQSPPAQSERRGSRPPLNAQNPKTPSPQPSTSSNPLDFLSINNPGRSKPKMALTALGSMGPPKQRLKRQLSDESLSQGQPLFQRPALIKASSLATRGSRHTMRSQAIFDRKDDAIYALKEAMKKANVLIAPELMKLVEEAEKLGKNSDGEVQKTNLVDITSVIQDWLMTTNDTDVSDTISISRVNNPPAPSSPTQPRYVHYIKSLGKLRLSRDEYINLIQEEEAKLLASASGPVGVLRPMEAEILTPRPEKTTYATTPASNLIPFIPNGLTAAGAWNRVNTANYLSRSQPIHPAVSYAARLEARIKSRPENEQRAQESMGKRLAKATKRAGKAAKSKEKALAEGDTVDYARAKK